MQLTDPVTGIKGVGDKTVGLFAKMGITNIEQLFEYFPKNYEKVDSLEKIDGLTEGKVAAIEASLVRLPQLNRNRNLPVLSARFRDDSGEINVVWFRMAFLRNQLKMGVHYILRGQVVRKNGVLVMHQPKLLTMQEFSNMQNKWFPVYALTKGITNHTILKAVKNALDTVEFSEEYLPLEIRKECHLIAYKDAVKKIHFPKDENDIFPARKRMIFDEFFLFQLAIRKLRERKRKQKNIHSIQTYEQTEQLIRQLPYILTDAQKKVWEEIQADLRSDYVMNRLIQGDVGSGKTILSVLALLSVVENGYQGAIMVPTEVLAKQHEKDFRQLLEPFGVRIGLLIGSMTAKEKKQVKENIKAHEIDLVIGTHALIQDSVEYDCLALVVTDEQHRFGVRQREKLSGKGDSCHVLVMSATPIPRTLAIILYGELDISIVDELPKNRLPIKNCVVDTSYRETAYHFIDEQVKEGHQAYVICPMVEESEAVEAENVIDYCETLKQRLSPGVRTDYLHGKMKASEKDEIMTRFAEGELDVLVSTTVVEVGVNVKNATVMMIENSERFGLAQLHQLRGRVGRGEFQSYCIFMTGNRKKETMERLDVLAKSNDGFLVAKEDLKQRGPGDFFGIRQSGLLEFKIGDVFQNADILKLANEAVGRLEQKDAELILKKHQALAERIKRYGCEMPSL